MVDPKFRSLVDQAQLLGVNVQVRRLCIHCCGSHKVDGDECPYCEDGQQLPLLVIPDVKEPDNG